MQKRSALASFPRLLQRVHHSCYRCRQLFLEPLESRDLLATLPPDFIETAVAVGLSSATAMEVAPNGDLWVVEQAGAVKRFRPNNANADVVGNVSTLGLSSSGERGLLGITFDPQYSTNKQVYLYYTALSPSTHNRISRFTVIDTDASDYFFSGASTVPDDAGSSGTPTQSIVFELDPLSGATNHNGGAIHFGPDNKLYAAVGDNASSGNSQSLETVLGKMLRINSDGTIPADNPFYGATEENNRAIWAIGLRNPFTFAFQPGTGRMFINDVGQNAWEEINDGHAGANYGWPGVEGDQGTPPPSPGVYHGPLYAYEHGGAPLQGFAITGGAFYNPAVQQFPAEYVGGYFFADYVNDWINVFDVGSGTATPFATNAPGTVDLRVTSDGSLYYLARDANKVFRVTATPSWSGFAHDAQHTAVSSYASQPLQGIAWQTPVDLAPQYTSNGNLLIHYGSPLVTAANTVIVPVKTGPLGGFQVEGINGVTGAVKWTQSTDYVLPPHNWVPSYSPTLTPTNRLYFAGAGGTVYYINAPNADGASTDGQLAFYGMANYAANPGAYNGTVFINTPITSDSAGNIYFGFQVTGTNPSNLQSGIARISASGIGTWISAAAASGDPGIIKVVTNSAPALSNDGTRLYVAMNSGDFGYGALVAIDSTTLSRIGPTGMQVRLKDPNGNDALLSDSGTASPTVGPNGDVFFGVFENPFGYNHYRGWLQHFSGDLTQTYAPGAFGWDITPSVVPRTMVPSYTGASPYLLMTKYNNYSAAEYELAILDPYDTMSDPISGRIVMKEILTITGVNEWCINTAVVDPQTGSVLVNNEDGKLYRWNLSTNTLTESVVLTAGLGQAYTPTIIGVDGTVYAIGNATLFAVRQISSSGQTLAIDAGGGPSGSYVADQSFSGGSPYGTGAAIDTSGVSNPAPQAVYQTVRYGNFTYTLSGLTPGGSYTVRLHFAEIYFTATGQRVFNVQINGSQVLTNFDIVAVAGAANKAIVTPFTATADATGEITITFSSVVNNAMLNGLEILTAAPNTPPVVATAASSSSNPVTGTTTNLSVRGDDADTGESSLTYAWSVVSLPLGAPSPSFSVNGANAAKDTTATFYQVGSYTFRATVTDPAGASVTSDVSVTVNQTGSSVGVTPATATVVNDGTQSFTANILDQFGAAMSSQPSFTWTLDGGSIGSVNSSGLYTAPTSGTGSATVRATGGGMSGTASVTVTVASSQTLAIDAGGGPSGSYVADQSFSGGSPYGTGAAIDTSGVSNPAPQAVYQTVRYGNFTYTLSGLTPSGSYTVRLHFAEVFFTQSGQRVFHVQANGNQVLTDFDIVAEAGAANKAVVEQFTVTANSSGAITLTFVSVVNNAMLNGVEVLPNTTADDVALDAGGGPSGSYVADQSFSGGLPWSTGAAIDTSGVSNPAPQAVYQTVRYGNFTYTLSGLAPGGSYTVRLHFAEIFFTAAGQRVFNVQINSSQVLTNFDIVVAAGAANKAIVTPFTATADATGEITITFVSVVNNALLNGLEILTA